MKSNILIIGAGFGGMWSALSAVRLLDQHERLDSAVPLEVERLDDVMGQPLVAAFNYAFSDP